MEAKRKRGPKLKCPKAFGFRPDSKAYKMGRLLARPKGVSMNEIVNAPWNPAKETMYNPIKRLIARKLVVVVKGRPMRFKASAKVAA